MLYFSSLLQNETYKSAAERVFSALNKEKMSFALLENTKDIWVRDYMPIKNKKGEYISFRYEPSYLKNDKNLKTKYSQIAKQLPIKAKYNGINLDGGNAVFSPSKRIVIISNRVFSENPEYGKSELKNMLQKELGAEIVIIPSLKSDMTGHADGMVRFINENTVFINESSAPNGLESKIKTILKRNDITAINFPYFETKHKSKDGVNSAEGCYINYLETYNAVFVPIFGSEKDKTALKLAEANLCKKAIGVNINEIALNGGLLNCISWEI